MGRLGIHTLEPAEELGPQPGWKGVELTSNKIGVIPFYALAFAIPAAGGGLAGAVLSPKRRLRGIAIGALGGGIGGLTAVMVLKAVSQ
jgi:hypothetical protein